MKVASIGLLVTSIILAVIGLVFILLANVMNITYSDVISLLKNIFEFNNDCLLVSWVVIIGLGIFMVLFIGVFVASIIKKKPAFICISILSLIPIAGFVFGAVCYYFANIINKYEFTSHILYTFGYYCLFYIAPVLVFISLFVTFVGLLKIRSSKIEQDEAIKKEPIEDKSIKQSEDIMKQLLEEDNAIENKIASEIEEEKPLKDNKAKKPSSAPKQTDEKQKALNVDSTAVVYHISQRKELNKWQVKRNQAAKAVKLFDTQKEAIDYANQLAKSQGGSIRIHSRVGKIRKS